MSRTVLAMLVVAALGCGDGPSGTLVYFDLDGNVATERTFWDSPFPSDLRLLDSGRPDLSAYPNPRSTPIVDGLLSSARDRIAFSTLPAVYFRFDSAMPILDADTVIPASVDQNILFIDIDADSPSRGRLYPVVAYTIPIDDWVQDFMIAIAPRPGFILDGNTTYAVVVRRSLGDAAGDELGQPKALKQLAAGKTPSGMWGEQAATLFAPLWDVLAELGVDADDVAAATVFTTTDVVVDLAQLSDDVKAAYSVTIDNIALDPTDGATHSRFCELLATVEYPQFQVGEPPFDQEGLFDIGPDGLPVLQRMETATVVLTIPKVEMPADGYPVMMYYHGSGGVPASMVDRGARLVVGGPTQIGEGPAFVVAEHGIAGAATALPLSPDRLPGAAYTEYLNFANLPAFRDTFRQGVVEQRLFLDALLDLSIDPAVLSSCTGPTLPVGATSFKFDGGKVGASGQSMGGMYTNLITPVESRIRVAVPTGAGGFWHLMILDTDLIVGVRDLIAIVLGVPDGSQLTFMHPGMQLIHLGWEAVEPMVFMPRIARKPLPGHPVRPVYEPIGEGDAFFSTNVYDAAALAYGHQQAGDLVWPGTQDALLLDGLGGVVDYPISANLTSADGSAYTGIAVQYAEDGIDDGHFIYAQRDEVKYQYGCFFKTFFDSGVATVPAPAPFGTPCATQ